MQRGHRPSPLLKEKKPGFMPRARAVSVSAKRERISSKTPAYTAGVERGVRTMWLWSTITTYSRYSQPLIDLTRAGSSSHTAPFSTSAFR